MAPTCVGIFDWSRFTHMGCMATTYQRTFRNIGENSLVAQRHVSTTIVLPQRLRIFRKVMPVWHS